MSSDLGTLAEPGEISAECLYDVLRALPPWMRDHSEDQEEEDSTGDALQKIEAWLVSRTNLGFETSGVFSDLIEEFRETPRDNRRISIKFSQAISAIEDAWIKLETRDMLKFMATEPAREAIQTLIDGSQALDPPVIDNADEWEQYRRFADSATTVLEWFDGQPAAPLVFVQHLPTFPPKKGAHVKLLRQWHDFSICLMELDEILTYCAALGDTSQAHTHLEKVKSRLDNEIHTFRFLSPADRKASEKRGRDLIEGLCSVKFDFGNIRPYVLFKYAADCGMTSAVSEMLIADRSQLKPGAVVC